jgi:molybdopterin synthase sulfur carrier subunit
MSTIAVTSITVNVVYLARLREAFGRSGEALALASGATVADVVATLRGRGEAFARELAQGRAVRVAVNHDLAPSDTILRDGDEVALLPPVTGG